VATAGIQILDQASAALADLVDLVRRQPPGTRLLRQHNLTVRRRQALAGEVAGVRPIVFVGLVDGHLTVLVRQGLGEGRTRPLRVANVVDVAGATGQDACSRKHAQNPKFAHGDPSPYAVSIRPKETAGPDIRLPTP